MMTARKKKMLRWMSQRRYQVESLTPASSDASFRRYFRSVTDRGVFIIMDAPPAHEDCEPFIRVDRALLAAGLNVPRIHEINLEEGFLLLDDLGDRQYLAALNNDTVENLYGDAFEALLKLQANGPQAESMPRYDEALLMREMELFREWFLRTHLGMTLDDNACQVLDKTYAFLAENALLQPQVPVHRDYHSRNLMVTEQNNPGILDFQDAVFGAVTYDLVSLLRDCYISWPCEQVEDWVLDYRKQAIQAGLFKGDHYGERQFLRWFDLMGVQRHLKAIGIFARLYHRDGKSGYLRDIPRTLGYIKAVSSRYDELQGLYEQVQGLMVGERVFANARHQV